PAAGATSPAKKLAQEEFAATARDRLATFFSPKSWHKRGHDERPNRRRQQLTATARLKARNSDCQPTARIAKSEQNS
ncbi:MAG: hypothetical protein AAGG46_12465, partial [Planctomycetota bacterium]